MASWGKTQLLVALGAVELSTVLVRLATRAPREFRRKAQEQVLIFRGEDNFPLSDGAYNVPELLRGSGLYLSGLCLCGLVFNYRHVPPTQDLIATSVQNKGITE